MQSTWFSDIKDPKLQKQFKENVLSSKLVLDKLRELCYNRLKNRELSSDFDNPNWPYKQASLVGEAETLKWMISILTFSDNEI
jgi:hypothetical protein